MTWKESTVIFVCAGTAVVLGYDIVAYANGGIDATISTLVHKEALAVPFIPFCFGFLMGHFFG